MSDFLLNWSSATGPIIGFKGAIYKKLSASVQGPTTSNLPFFYGPWVQWRSCESLSPEGRRAAHNSPSTWAWEERRRREGHWGRGTDDAWQVDARQRSRLSLRTVTFWDSRCRIKSHCGRVESSLNHIISWTIGNFSCCKLWMVQKMFMDDIEYDCPMILKPAAATSKNSHAYTSCTKSTFFFCNNLYLGYRYSSHSPSRS